MKTGTIYVLHFDRSLHHARHYVGYARNLRARLQAHANGRGARLTQVCRERGITWTLVRRIPGTRTDERRLKNQHNGPRLCPLCRRQQEIRP